jgi:hypothetical protein
VNKIDMVRGRKKKISSIFTTFIIQEKQKNLYPAASVTRKHEEI